MNKIGFIALLLISFKAWCGIHPSLLLFHEWDLQNCSNQTEQLIAMGAQKVNIVPTLHYIQKNNYLEQICFKSIQKKCVPIDKTISSKFSNYLLSCLKPLIDNGIKVKITPHLDSLNKQSFWRNKLLFDPLKEMSQANYYQVMLKPILKALSQTSYRDHQIQLALQGEMGATIFYAPKSYIQLKELIIKEHPRIEVGISVNYNELSGNYLLFDQYHVQKLLDAVDFIGFSAYTPIILNKYGLMKNHFQSVVDLFIDEWIKLGLYIANDKKLIFSEVGLGGGNSSQDGKTVSASIYEAASRPHSGITHKEINPWKRQDLKNFRRYFYSELKYFFHQQKSVNSFKVHDAYIWNADSWDVLGFYPQTSHYRDLFIAKKILNLNL